MLQDNSDLIFKGRSVQEGLLGVLTLEMRLLHCLRMWETSYRETWFHIPQQQIPQ